MNQMLSRINRFCFTGALKYRFKSIFASATLFFLVMTISLPGASASVKRIPERADGIATTSFTQRFASVKSGSSAVINRKKAKKSFPVTISSGGYKDTVPTRPTRILCLSASSTQMLYAIGAGKQVVAVDKYSAYPKNAPRTSFTGYETSAEDYLPYHPNLVILAFNENNMVQQLNVLHIPVLVMPAANTIRSADIQMLQLGLATGHYLAAKKQVNKLATTLHQISHRVGNKGQGLTYFIELSPSLYTATSSTFIGSVFSLFKMKNIAGQVKYNSNYPQINSSFLLKSNPDIVILADTVCCGQTPKSFASRPGYSVLQAVKNHNVYGVNDSVASEWGPHTLVVMAQYLAQVLIHRAAVKSHLVMINNNLSGRASSVYTRIILSR